MRGSHRRSSCCGYRSASGRRVTTTAKRTTGPFSGTHRPARAKRSSGSPVARRTTTASGPSSYSTTSTATFSTVRSSVVAFLAYEAVLSLLPGRRVRDDHWFAGAGGKRSPALTLHLLVPLLPASSRRKQGLLFVRGGRKRPAQGFQCCERSERAAFAVGLDEPFYGVVRGHIHKDVAGGLVSGPQDLLGLEVGRSGS